MKTFLTKGIPSLTDLDGAYERAAALHARRRHDGHHRCGRWGSSCVRASVMRRQGFDPKVLLAGGSAKLIAPYLYQEEVP